MEPLLHYAVIGIFYWLAGLAIFGTPRELTALPRAVRWPAQAVTCLVTVAAWPLALYGDLGTWRRSSRR